jgi:putative membrane-bound dehydrogenase-like protein
MNRLTPVIAILIATTTNLFAADELPRAIDKRLKIELFAEHPTVVTPTGLDVDHAGRVWAIESNTHFPPKGYNRHPSDRLYVMRDTNGDGKADDIKVFADGFTHAMSVAIKPLWLYKPEAQASEPKRQHATQVYIATRREIILLTDTNNDLKPDSRKQIIKLETEGNYPHNGLAGLAFDALGWMYFGFGENLGADYKIIGSDGTTLSGGGEGGNLYRCRPDGSKLKQWARGFWNPHASCVDAFGRVFTVDNDADSRPPCRLLHIIQGGDYGFRFSNGRKGLHPFTAWNGEIPGTLPMVAGTGEAPSGIVAYESDGLPDDYIGNLLVGSWGDHRIDRFRLKPKGASFESVAEPIIQGEANFRPVGLAVAPDGSLFCTDWVQRDYKVHGQGRIWRVSMKDQPKRKVIDAATITAKTPVGELKGLLKSKRLNVRRMAGSALARTAKGRQALKDAIGSPSEAGEVEAIYALAFVPPKTEMTGLFKLLGGALPPRIRSKRAQYVWRSLFADDTPQLPYSGETRVLVGMFLIDTLFPRKTADPAIIPLAIRSSGEWPPRIFFEPFPDLPPSSDDDELRAEYRKAVDEADSFVFASFVDGMALSKDLMPSNTAKRISILKSPRVRLAYLLSGKRRNPREQASLRYGLRDTDPQVRRAAVQWVAEENLTGFRPHVEAILDDAKKPMTTDLFLATLAALEMLDGKSPKDFDKTPAGKYVLPLLKDAKRPAAVRRQALRLVDPTDPALDETLFANLLADDDKQLQLAAVRTLQHATQPFAGGLLRGIATDVKRSQQMRAEAIVGLGGRGQLSKADREALLSLMASKDAALRSEALRSLRGVVNSDETVKGAIAGLAKTTGGLRPPLANEITLALKGVSAGLRPPLADGALDGGNAAVGRRVFFHANSAGCYKCHTVDGRGGKLGPDLTTIARTMNRKKLAESILEPSKEISPQFTTWTFIMDSGKVHNGMLLGDVRDDIQHIGTTDGKTVALKASEIEERRPQRASIMPEKLSQRLTPNEFRHLLAYLESLK